jgi:hypothetical protein
LDEGSLQSGGFRSKIFFLPVVSGLGQEDEPAAGAEQGAEAQAFSSEIFPGMIAA